MPQHKRIGISMHGKSTMAAANSSKLNCTVSLLPRDIIDGASAEPLSPATPFIRIAGLDTAGQRHSRRSETQSNYSKMRLVLPGQLKVNTKTKLQDCTPSTSTAKHFKSLPQMLPFSWPPCFQLTIISVVPVRQYRFLSGFAQETKTLQTFAKCSSASARPPCRQQMLQHSFVFPRIFTASNMTWNHGLSASSAASNKPLCHRPNLVH